MTRSRLPSNGARWLSDSGIRSQIKLQQRGWAINVSGEHSGASCMNTVLQCTSQADISVGSITIATIAAMRMDVYPSCQSLQPNNAKHSNSSKNTHSQTKPLISQLTYLTALRLLVGATGAETVGIPPVSIIRCMISFSVIKPSSWNGCFIRRFSLASKMLNLSFLKVKTLSQCQNSFQALRTRFG